MDAYLNVQNKLVTCPYDEAHKVKESRLQLHIAKCKLNNLDKVKETCPFNATHVFSHSERDYHLLNCPDKAPLDRKLAQSLDRNNPFKGRTAVPAFSDPLPAYSDETWDEDMNNTDSASNHHPTPANVIVELPPLSKPSVRRNIYKELHKMKPDNGRSTDPDKDKDTSQSAEQQSHRQPKQLSEIAQTRRHQNFQPVQTLGLGRGKPTSRIAANIFEKPANVNNQPQAADVSGITNSFNNLGLGRGQKPNKGAVLLLDDDDEFPALGCGRGVFKPTKQNPRIPGAKLRN